MDWFERIKELYSSGKWSKMWVWDTVTVNRITKIQYEEITGDTYPIERPSSE